MDIFEYIRAKHEFNVYGQLIIVAAIILITLFVFIIMINTFIMKKRLKRIEKEMKITNSHMSHVDSNNHMDNMTDAENN